MGDRLRPSVPQLCSAWWNTLNSQTVGFERESARLTGLTQAIVDMAHKSQHLVNNIMFMTALSDRFVVSEARLPSWFSI